MHRSFPADPVSVPRARRFLAETLRAHGLSPWPADLLVSELVGNVVFHARTEFHLDVDVSERVRVEVRDGSAVLPAIQAASEDAVSGRGLVLVEALSEAWGVASDESGKSVWFELSPNPAQGRSG